MGRFFLNFRPPLFHERLGGWTKLATTLNDFRLGSPPPTTPCRELSTARFFPRPCPLCWAASAQRPRLSGLLSRPIDRLPANFVAVGPSVPVGVRLAQVCRSILSVCEARRVVCRRAGRWAGGARRRKPGRRTVSEHLWSSRPRSACLAAARSRTSRA